VVADCVWCIVLRVAWCYWWWIGVGDAWCWSLYHHRGRALVGVPRLRRVAIAAISGTKNDFIDLLLIRLLTPH